ncbi:unnamed protein product [Lota lota]
MTTPVGPTVPPIGENLAFTGTPLGSPSLRGPSSSAATTHGVLVCEGHIGTAAWSWDGDGGGDGDREFPGGRSSKETSRQRHTGCPLTRHESLPLGGYLAGVFSDRLHKNGPAWRYLRIAAHGPH